jgi:hypothetical protein
MDRFCASSSVSTGPVYVRGRTLSNHLGSVCPHVISPSYFGLIAGNLHIIPSSFHEASWR